MTENASLALSKMHLQILKKIKKPETSFVQLHCRVMITTRYTDTWAALGRGGEARLQIMRLCFTARHSRLTGGRSNHQSLSGSDGCVTAQPAARLSLRPPSRPVPPCLSGVTEYS